MMFSTFRKSLGSSLIGGGFVLAVSVGCENGENVVPTDDIKQQVEQMQQDDMESYKKFMEENKEEANPYGFDE